MSPVTDSRAPRGHPWGSPRLFPLSWRRFTQFRVSSCNACFRNALCRRNSLTTLHLGRVDPRPCSRLRVFCRQLRRSRPSRLHGWILLDLPCRFLPSASRSVNRTRRSSRKRLELALRSRAPRRAGRDTGARESERSLPAEDPSPRAGSDSRSSRLTTIAGRRRNRLLPSSSFSKTSEELGGADGTTSL